LSAEILPQRPLAAWWGRPCATDWMFVPGTAGAEGLLTLPEIDLLHAGQRSLLRFVGADAPLVAVHGPGAAVSGRPEQRGVTVDGAVLHVDLRWGGVVRHRMSTRQIPVGLSVRWDPWAHALVFEPVGTVPLGAFCVAPHAGVNRVHVEGIDWDPTRESRQPVSESIHAALDLPGPVHVTVGADGDSAVAAAHAIRRSVGRPPASAIVVPEGAGPRAVENLRFCRLASLGRTIDTGEWVPVTSRSPRYDLPAVFMAADWFRWALPAVATCDPEAAREGTIAACRFGASAPGMHALDMSGTPQFLGFRLDAACDIVLGVGGYVQATGDESILSEADVDDALRAVAEELPHWHDPQFGLFRTELAPSGDLPPGPFLAVPNAMAIAAYEVLGRLRIIEGTSAVGKIAALWRQFFVREGWIVGAVGAEGQPFSWDDPTASMTMLGRLGTLDRRDQGAWRQTVQHLLSPANPNHVPGRFPGERTTAMGGPCLHSLAERMQAFPPGAEISEEGRSAGEAAPFDADGMACTTFDAATGHALSGVGWGAGAGMLAVALLAASGL